MDELILNAFDFLSCALNGGKVYTELSLDDNGEWGVDKECQVVLLPNGEAFLQKCDTDEEFFGGISIISTYVM